MADGRVIIEAILDATNVTKNIKKLNQDLKGITWKDIEKGNEKAKELSLSFKDAGTACTAKLTAPVVAAGAAAFSVAKDYESSTARIQAAFGVTREEAEKFKDIGTEIYEGAWGESMDQVTDALIQCRSTIRDIDDNGLKEVTETALMLESTFGADVNETIRGTNALMEGFGLTSTQACDLMTKGMQRGLNYTDELGDNLSEYSVRWGQAGMSASKYFSLLEAGTSNGAYNLDKVGDFLNEFLTSLSDGRLEGQMSKFSKSTQDVFNEYKNGGATAEQVLNAVIGEMAGMTDETKRAQIASETWSSLGEDNAMSMILSLANVQDSYSDVAGAAQSAGDAASDSFGNKAQSAMRTVLGSLESFGDPLLNIASMVAEVAGAFGNWLSSLPAPGQQAVVVIASILAAIGPVLSTIGTLLTTVPRIVSAIKLVSTTMSALNAVMRANPIGVVVTVIGLLVSAFMYLWNTSEEFRNFWIGLWDGICQTVSGIASWFYSTVIQPIINGFNSFSSFVSSIFSKIGSTINNSIKQISNFVLSIISTLQRGWNNIFSGIYNTARSIWSGIYSTISNFIQSAHNVVSSIVNAIRTTISNVFNGVRNTVSSIWNGIKSAIQTPLEAAKNVVRNIINAIKGFFSFKISWPKIPMPQFKINPSGWQIGDLLHGSIPSLGIEWYAKGAVFNGAQVIGIGEAGPEAAMPLQGRHMQPFADAVAEGIGATSSEAEVSLLRALLEELSALRRELPQMMAAYCLRVLEVNGREFARLVQDTEGLI